MTAFQTSVMLRLEILHILDEIHRNEEFDKVSHLVTPQGLVSLITCASASPRSLEMILSEVLIETWGEERPNTSAYLSNEFMIFCESISMEIDMAATNMINAAIQSGKFQGGQPQTPFYFRGWFSTSVLILGATTIAENNNELFKESIQLAKQHRHYDGCDANFSGYIGLFDTL